MINPAHPPAPLTEKDFIALRYAVLNEVFRLKDCVVIVENQKVGRWFGQSPDKPQTKNKTS